MSLGLRAPCISKRVSLKGGGHQDGRAIRKLTTKAARKTFYPGKPRSNPGGRPREITEHQETEIARVAMDLKKRKIAPNPARVRAVLPRLARNKETAQPISDGSIRSIFKTKCYDDTEDDPWHWLGCPSQDFLLKGSRLARKYWTASPRAVGPITLP